MLLKEVEPSVRSSISNDAGKQLNLVPKGTYDQALSARRQTKTSSFVRDSNFVKGMQEPAINKGKVMSTGSDHITSVDLGGAAPGLEKAASLQLNGQSLSNRSHPGLALGDSGATEMTTGALQANEYEKSLGMVDPVSDALIGSGQSTRSHVDPKPNASLTSGSSISFSTSRVWGRSKTVESHTSTGSRFPQQAQVQIAMQSIHGVASSASLNSGNEHASETRTSDASIAKLLAGWQRNDGSSPIDPDSAHHATVPARTLVEANLTDLQDFNTATLVHAGEMTSQSTHIASTESRLSGGSTEAEIPAVPISLTLSGELRGVSPATQEAISATIGVMPAINEDAAKTGSAAGVYGSEQSNSTMKNSEKGMSSLGDQTSAKTTKSSRHEIGQSQMSSSREQRAVQPLHTYESNGTSPMPLNAMMSNPDQMTDRPATSQGLLPSANAFPRTEPALDSGSSLTNPFHRMDNVVSYTHPQFTSSVRSLEASLPQNDSGISTVSARLIEGRVSASLLTDSAESLASLGAHLGSLHSFMAESGTPISQVTIGLEGGDRRGSTHDQRESPQGSREEHRSPMGTAQEVFTQTHNLISGNVDIRV